MLRWLMCYRRLLYILGVGYSICIEASKQLNNSNAANVTSEYWGTHCNYTTTTDLFAARNIIVSMTFVNVLRYVYLMQKLCVA